MWALDEERKKKKHQRENERGPGRVALPTFVPGPGWARHPGQDSLGNTPLRDACGGSR